MPVGVQITRHRERDACVIRGRPCLTPAPAGCTVRATRPTRDRPGRRAPSRVRAGLPTSPTGPTRSRVQARASIRRRPPAATAEQPGRRPPRGRAQAVRRGRGGRRHRPRDRATGEFFSMLGPSGLGQDHDAADDRRLRAADRRAASCSHGEDVSQRAAVRARRQHGLPGLRALPAHDRRRQRRLRADGPQGARRPSARRASRDALRMVRLEGYERAPAQPAVRRPAPARRARARARQPAAGAAPRRAARRARPEAARGDADRAQGASSSRSASPSSTSPTTRRRRSTMSDRLAVFNRGRIEQVGAPAEVYERPATRFVAGFVGTSNLLARRGRARRSSAQAGTFTVRPEKIHLAEPGDGRRGRRASAPRPRSGTSSTSARIRATSSRSTRAAELVVTQQNLATVLDGGARPAGQGCPPRAGSGSTVSPSRTGTVSGREEEEQAA